MEKHWEHLSEGLKLSGESRARIRAQLASRAIQREAISMKKKTSYLRGPVIAAALAVVMVVTVSAAALLGVFDGLKKQDYFALLGMTEAYEEYAYKVGLSATTENGDVFTLEKAVMDGTFCTIFYSYHYAQPVMTQAEFEALDGNTPWDAYPWAPQMDLLLNEVEISEEGYQNSFELQQYLADTSTVYGAWRSLLTTPPADGEQLKLQGFTWDVEAKKPRNFSLCFTAHPYMAAVNDPGVTFSMYWGGKTMEIEVGSLSRSPLGSLLTLRYERNLNSGLGLDGSFALRDQDTGEYIPFARVWTRNNSGGNDDVVDTYELFGDVSGLKTLELIPVWYTSARAEKTVVPLSALPDTDPSATSGGYAPASYWVEKDNRLIVEMKPIGPVTTHYSSIGNGVCFLDEAGNELFGRGTIEKFKDRATGTITVVTTIEDPEDFVANVDQVAAIWFFTNDYTLLEAEAVTIPLPISLNGNEIPLD